MSVSNGIHHVTAIAGDPRRNVQFYTGTLGLRFVKKTVNFDDPDTYHLYYGDGDGTPGSIMTFFPWPQARPGRQGLGQAVETAFAIPSGSVAFWIDRLAARSIPCEVPVKRFGQTVIALRDPDGMTLELVASDGIEALDGWTGGGVPAEHAIRGFAGATLWVSDPTGTAEVLTAAFGYSAGQEEAGHRRFTTAGSAPLGRWIDLRAVPDAVRGTMGAGTIHHVAFRAEDDAAQSAMAAKLARLGISTTEQVDRNYFRSIYFREPGGVIFEIATDAPGFAVDEPKETLGHKLMLPPWLEARRAEVEASLPALA